MRKAGSWLLALGLVVGLVAGCGAPSKSSMTSKLQTQQEKLDATNYKSTAKMTVQMDNGSQTYYIETNFESPEVYKISLGDANKNINQVIVRNNNGMFVVSPSLQKVFRFNGDWAQNQGHIYLYDQILKQLVETKDWKMTSKDGVYTFSMPVAQANDIVSRQEVQLDQALKPKQVVLYDKDDKPVVKLEYTSFTIGVKFNDGDFDPHKIATDPKAAKATLATNQTELHYIEPEETLGNSLDVFHEESGTAALLRYAGDSGFVLHEAVANPGVTGLPTGSLVDLFGVPALYSGSNDAHQLIWMNNGIEFSLTSSKLTLDEMKQVAISTLAQVGK
jgi:outer membrane lipoprotein-sorting protein